MSNRPLERVEPAGSGPESADVRRRVLALGGIDVRRSVLALASILGVAAAAVALACARPGPWTIGLAFLLVASRQHALLILLHECWHGLLLPSREATRRIGRLVSPFVGSKYELAREQHLEHHRRLGTGADPDRELHSSRDKATRGALAWYFLRRMLGGQLAVSHQLAGEGAVPRAGLDRALIEIAVAQLGLWAVLWAVTGRWWIYPVLWALPLATATTFFNSVRAFTEHAVPPEQDDREPSRYFSIAASPLERFFFAPLCFHCHAEHHLFPTIPYHRLPAVRRLLLAHPEAYPGYALRRGYLAFLAGYWRSLPG